MTTTIVDKRNKMLQFVDLSEGDWFVCDEVLYQKSDCTYGYTVLKHSRAPLFREDETVEPVNVTITIE